MEDNGSKLNYLVPIAVNCEDKEIKNKKKYHNDLFKSFKYFIKSSSFITINQKRNSNANEEKSLIF